MSVLSSPAGMRTVNAANERAGNGRKRFEKESRERKETKIF